MKNSHFKVLFLLTLFTGLAHASSVPFKILAVEAPHQYDLLTITDRITSIEKEFKTVQSCSIFKVYVSTIQVLIDGGEEELLVTENTSDFNLFIRLHTGWEKMTFWDALYHVGGTTKRMWRDEAFKILKDDATERLKTNIAFYNDAIDCLRTALMVTVKTPGDHGIPLAGLAKRLLSKRILDLINEIDHRKALEKERLIRVKDIDERYR